VRQLVIQALVRPKPRRATKPSRAAKRRRVEDKRKRSQVKSNRGPAGTGLTARQDVNRWNLVNQAFSPLARARRP
jgi:hypothetical protein